MSESGDRKRDADDAEAGREPYEAPRLISVGNARDLLAGATGSIQDGICGIEPTQPSG
jgi:hypothetical protein